MTKVSGVVSIPDRFHVTVEAESQFPKSYIEISVITIEDTAPTPWSPDSKFLVVAGSKSEAARSSNGRTPTGDRIYVLDAEGSAAPRDLGAGVLAFWSWN